MNILAFECSAKAASTALLSDGKLITESFQNCGFTHSRTLLPLAESMLLGVGKTFEDIDIFATSSGPGSFTGLRIGISLIKGLAYALDKPCVGISSLKAMAYLLPPSDSVLCAVMDARAGQVYNALFDISSYKPKRLCEDRAITIENLTEELHAIKRKVIIIGDGAYLFDGKGFNDLPEYFRIQKASGVAFCAMESERYSPFQLTPAYHRLPQAERERIAKLKNTQGV